MNQRVSIYTKYAALSMTFLSKKDAFLNAGDIERYQAITLTLIKNAEVDWWWPLIDATGNKILMPPNTGA